MLDLWRIRCFVAVGETEHIGAAAARLHISASPLSRQIRQLEDELGVQLLARFGRRIRLTSAGRNFLRLARDLIDHADRLEREGRRLAAPDVGPVTIGYIQEAVLCGVIPSAVKSIGSRTSISLAIRNLKTPEQMISLCSSDIDVAIVNCEQNPEVYENRLFFEEPYVVAFALDHRLASSKNAEIDDLRKEIWVGPPLEIWESVNRLLTDGNSRTAANYETYDIAASLSMVAAGVGFTIVQKSVADTYASRIAYRQLPKSLLNLRLYAVWNSQVESLATLRVVEELATCGRNAVVASQ